MLSTHPSHFTSRATVVAYDLSSVINLLSGVSQSGIIDFTHFVLHQYFHHAVEGFHLQQVASSINYFEHQTDAISTLYWLLQFPIAHGGERVITKHQDNMMWVAYLDVYYTPDGN